MKLISLLLLIFLGWQSSPSPAAIQGKVSPELQVKLIRLQLQATRIQAQFTSCQQTDFQGQMNQVQTAIAPVVDAAYHEAKLKREEWDLNLDTFEFVRKPAAAAPVPVAPGKPAVGEEKKP